MSPKFILHIPNNVCFIQQISSCSADEMHGECQPGNRKQSVQLLGWDKLYFEVTERFMTRLWSWAGLLDPPHLLQQPDEAHYKSISPSLISIPS